MILIFVTFPNRKEAEKIADHLLEIRLAACVTMFSVVSYYRWKGKKVKEKEIEMIIKTKKEKFATIKREIEKMHSYEAPQIIAVEVTAVSRRYKQWVEGEVV